MLNKTIDEQTKTNMVGDGYKYNILSLLQYYKINGPKTYYCLLYFLIKLQRFFAKALARERLQQSIVPVAPRTEVRGRLLLSLVDHRLRDFRSPNSQQIKTVETTAAD